MKVFKLFLVITTLTSTVLGSLFDKENFLKNVQLPQKRIVNGNLVPLGKHPYLASVLSVVSQNRIGICGGSLISPTVVLSAAHCFSQEAQSVVTVFNCNDFNRLGVAEDGECFVIPVINDAIPSAFDINLLNGDIWLLKLESAPQEINSIVRPIALLNTTFSIPVGLEGTVAGFGSTTFANDPDDDNSRLFDTQVSVANIEFCSFQEFDEELMVCTGGDNTSPCTGDSGGPLFAFTPSGREVQFGVVSFGTPQCVGGPAVFSKINEPGLFAFIEDFVAVNTQGESLTITDPDKAHFAGPSYISLSLFMGIFNLVLK